MDSDISELQCPVCYEVYNGKLNIPRLLSCGHCFCNYCLDQILAFRSFCPSCKHTVNTQDVTTLPINYPLKNLAEKYLENKPLGKAKQYISFGTCSVHNNSQQLYCLVHKEFLCGMCSTLNHKDCKVSVIEEALSDILTNYLETIETEESAIKEQDSIIEKQISITKYMLGKKREALKSWESSLGIYGEERNRLAKVLSDMIKLKQDMGNLKNLTPNNLKKHHTRFITLKKARVLELKNTPQHNLVTKLSPRQIWNKANNLHVYIERDFKKLCGTVTRDKKYLRIGYLKEAERLPKNCMKLEDFLYIITGSLNLPPKAFIQISLGKTELKPIIIKTEHSPRALNFLRLCLGISGFSYIGTKFYKVKDKGRGGERVYGGDYLFNNGSGSPALVDGICGGDMQTVRYKRGQVKGIQPMYKDSLSRFAIILRDAQEDDGWPSVFGVVESGINSMDDIAKRGGRKGKIKDASIFNCGLIVEHPEFG